MENQRTLDQQAQRNQSVSGLDQTVLERLYHRLAQDLSRASDRRSAIVSIAEALQAQSNAAVIFQIAMDSSCVDPEATTEINLVATQFAEVPANIEQWATTLGLKACSTGIGQQETSNDSDANLVHLFAIPTTNQQVQISEAIVCLFVNGSSSGDSEHAVALLAVNHLRQWEMLNQVREVERIAQQLSAVTELVARIETSDSLNSGCQRLANELSDYVRRIQEKSETPTKCHVYIGATDRKNESLEIVAISDTDSVDRNSEVVEFAESAMRECVSRNEISFWPADPASRQALLCHKQFANQAKWNALIAIPLSDSAGANQGCILLGSEKGLPNTIVGFLQGLATPVGVSMQLLRRATKSKLQLLLGRTFESIKSKKLKSAAKLVIAILLLAMIPLPYNVSSFCEVQPSLERMVAAPFDGQLETCFAKPGEEVSRDQVIATLDGRQIRLELASIEAELHGANKLRDGHIAAHESGEARLAQFEAERLRARYQLLIDQVENLELRSPIAGIVISEDLKTAEGMPVETGQVLFEVAPLDDLLLELSIPEDDVRFVEPGMRVVVRLNSYPFKNWVGTIDRVHPASELKNEENVFVAQVRLPNEDGLLRPGMQGRAKVKSVWRPVGWNLMHRPAAFCLRWIGW